MHKSLVAVIEVRNVNYQKKSPFGTSDYIDYVYAPDLHRSPEGR